MTAERVSYRLDLSEHRQDVAFIVPATKDAAYGRNEIVATVMQTASALPGHQFMVFFLGNPNPHGLHEFLSASDLLFDANESRVSLIAPVLRYLLTASQKPQLVIVGAPRVFDLADWDVHPFAIGCQNEISGSRCVANGDELWRHLVDPIVQISIDLNEFVPIAWSDPRFSMSIHNGQLSLCCKGEAPNHLDIIGQQFAETKPVAHSVRRSNHHDRINLRRITTNDQSPISVTLVGHEAASFYQQALGKPIACPYCEQTHATGTLRCQNDDSPAYRFTGKPIYPSLESVHKKGLFECLVGDATVACSYNGQSIVHTPNCSGYVLVGREVYRGTRGKDAMNWERVRSAWQRVGHIEGNRYVLNYD